MQIINTSDINEARKQILRLKKQGREIIVQAQNDEFNRKILENKDVDMIIGLESHNRKDLLKQRDSGLNEVLYKLAKKNNIKIGINLQEIKSLIPSQKAVVLARIIQNISLCKKIHTPIIIFPKTLKKQDALAFFLVLKASTQQAKLAF